MTGTLFRDPVTRKEILWVSRRWQTYLLRLAFVAVIGFVVFHFWQSWMRPGRQLSASEFADLGRRLFNMFVALEMGFVTLAAISAACDMVTKEVRAGTLGILTLTRLTALEIAHGKWKAATAQALSLILCGLPVLAICVYLGGVGAWDLLWSTCLAIAMAALGAAVAIRSSAMSQSPTAALVRSIVTLLAYTLIPLIAMPLTPIAIVLFLVHPVYAAFGASTRMFGQGGAGFGCLPATAVSLGVAVWLVRKSAPLILKHARTPAPPPRLSTDPALYEENYARLTLRGRRELLVRRHAWEGNPLLWKDWITRPAAHIPTVARVVVLFLVGAFIGLTWLETKGRSFGALYFHGSVFLLLAMINGAALFVREKEGRRFEMLLSTPLTPWQIVRTKLVAGLVAPESLVVLAFFLATVIGWSYWAGPQGMAMTAAMAATFLLFSYVLGAAISVHARTVRGAFVLTVGAVSFLVVGVPWLGSMIVDPSPDVTGASFVHVVTSLADPAGMFHRLTASRSLSGRILEELYWRTPDHSYCLAYVGLYGVATALLLAAMVRRLGRVPERG